jgi:hypothetical protein
MPPSLLKKRKRFGAGLTLSRIRGSTISTPQAAFAEQDVAEARAAAVALVASASSPELDLLVDPMAFPDRRRLPDTLAAHRYGSAARSSADSRADRASEERAGDADADGEDGTPSIGASGPRRCASLPPEAKRVSFVGDGPDQ